MLTVDEAKAKVEQVKRYGHEGLLGNADDVRFSLFWSAIYDYFVVKYPDDPITRLLLEVE
jgi:hypothetical protein